MTPQFKNDLNFYTLEVNESEETAQAMAEAFLEKFNALGKYDQMDLSLVIQTDGFEQAFEIIDKLQDNTI